MKEFIKRNMPVLAIGLATALIFLVIIILGESNSPNLLPNLRIVTEEEENEFNRTTIVDSEVNTSEETKQDTEEEDTYIFTPSELEKTRDQVLKERELSPEEVELNYGILEIRFTEDGFDPDRTNGKVTQKVTWINTTDEVLELEQIRQKFDDWKESNKIVPPGDSYTFTLTDDGLWTYKDVNSRKSGAIYITMPYKRADSITID